MKIFAAIFGLLLATCAAQGQFVLTTNQLSPFQYEVFFDGRLELVNNAPLDFNGPVHANGDFYASTRQTNSGVFQEAVSLGGSLVQPLDWAGATGMTNGPIFQGGLQTNVHRIYMDISSNTPAGRRELLYPPPDGEPVTSDVGKYRFYNKAQLVILVSNTTVKAWVKAGIAAVTSNAVPWSNNLSIFVSTNTTFYDQREHKTVRATQLNLFEMGRWSSTNSAVRTILGVDGSGNVGRTPNVIYVADFRTSDPNILNSIRLTNGQYSSTNNNGLTIATPNPLYVIGHYNCRDGNLLGTTNTTASVPAAIFCDAFTLLSPNWRDSQSSSNYTIRVASNTTVNAAICAGLVYSTGPDYGDYSGGVNNLVRLLEAWSAKTNTLNTSLVNLYDSAQATAAFVDPGQSNVVHYYSAPNRKYSHDPKLLNLATQPPGYPTFLQVNPTNPVAFSLQPTSHYAVLSNATTFQVQAAQYDGYPLTYQWYFNNTNLLVDATNATLSLDPVQMTDAGNYLVVVSDGTASATSAVARLAVFVQPRLVEAVKYFGLAGWSLKFSVTRGGRYVLQTTTNLTPPVTWVNTATNDVGNTSYWFVSPNNFSQEPNRYYRVVLCGATSVFF